MCLQVTELSMSIREKDIKLNGADQQISELKEDVLKLRSELNIIAEKNRQIIYLCSATGSWSWRAAICFS